MNKTQLIVAWMIFFNLIFLCVALAQPNLEVNGIFYDDKEPYVIVNDKVVKIGDTIDGAKVIEIKPDFVKFEYGNSVYEKKLSEKLPEVKKTETNAVQEPIKTTDTKEHYKKAKEYYIRHYLYGEKVLDCGSYPLGLENDLKDYKTVLEELDMAMYETTGQEREDVIGMMKHCNEQIERIEARIEQCKINEANKQPINAQPEKKKKIENYGETFESGKTWHWSGEGK